MIALLIVLALFGVLFLGLLVSAVLTNRTPAPPPPEDPAAPYREGLHAAIRMQTIAQDLEHQIYAEAAQHLDPEPPASDQAP